ncbi:hypothetical protein IFR05_015973, partial [Cadophora sp. M221]
MSDTNSNLTPPHNIILDQRTGHYIQITTHSVAERRTYLLDEVETCSSKSKEEREALMRYFRGILEAKKRYYHPPESRLESSPCLSMSRGGDQIQSEKERENESEIQDLSQSLCRVTGQEEDHIRDQVRIGIPGGIQDPQTSIQDQTPTQIPNPNRIRSQIPIRGQNTIQTGFQNSKHKQIPIPVRIRNPIHSPVQNQNQVVKKAPRQFGYTTPPNPQLKNLSNNIHLPTLQPP